MKKDIQNTKDIELLVNTFYEKVKTDDTIRYYFTDVVKVNWEQHLPVMYKFWENVLFYTGTYSGNPMKVHTAIDSKSPFSEEHFQHWLKHFNETVNELFEGENANLIMQRANNIAVVMQTKLIKK